MSKLKLLLLGGIFTLFGIFNFSSAKNYTITSDGNWGNYDPYPLHIEGKLGDYSVIEKVCSCSNCYLNFGTKPGRNNGGLNGNSFYGSVNSAGDIYFFNGFAESSSNCNFTKVVISDGKFDMYYNGLTPAVEGVKSTVNQIIPLMVFIGIGVLVVILGFILIRWLVNWLGGKIKSVFISKRG